MEDGYVRTCAPEISDLKNEVEVAESLGQVKDELRLFKIGIDVRSLKASMQLQVRAVNAYVRVFMPRELITLALESPKHGSIVHLAAPLRTHPPITVHKGTEIIVSNGYVALEFPAYVDSMASTLALRPHLLAQVLHCDRFTVDSLVGVASISMEQLMHKPLLDTYAPVLSQLIDTASGSKVDQVNVGALRVVLSMEDLGPVPYFQKRSQKLPRCSNIKVCMPKSGLVKDYSEGLQTNLSPLSCVYKRSKQQCPRPVPWEDFPVTMEGEKTCSESGDEVSQAMKVKSGKTQSREPKSDGLLDVSRRDRLCESIEKQVKDPCARDISPVSVLADERLKLPSSCGKELEKHPAYEMAWEFEMWRALEETKWRADLEVKEAATLAALQQILQKREGEILLQVSKIRQEHTSLEQKLRAKLVELEKREKALGRAEDSVSLKRSVLEQNLTKQASNVQVALKKLQAECEHRIEKELAKYAVLEDRYRNLEKHFAYKNALFSSLEKQFSEYKAAHKSRSETSSMVEVVLALQQQCTNVNERLASSIEARNKEQVQCLAKELVRLEHKIQELRNFQQDHIHPEQRKPGVSHLQKVVEDKQELEDPKYCRQASRLAASTAHESDPNAPHLNLEKWLNSIDHMDGLETIGKRESRARASTMDNGYIKESLNKQKVNDNSFRFTNCEPQELPRFKQSKPIGISQIPLCRVRNLSMSSDSERIQLMRDFNSVQATKFSSSQVCGTRELSQMPLPEIRNQLRASSEYERSQLMKDSHSEQVGITAVVPDNTSRKFLESNSLDKSKVSLESEVEMLRSHRSNLLSTGIYCPSDPVIKGLDQEILKLNGQDHIS